MLSRLKESLTLKTTLALIIILAVFLGLMALGINLRLGGSIREDALDRNEDMVYSIQQQIDMYLSAFPEIITVLARDEAVPAEEEDVLNDLFDRELEKQEDFHNIYYGTEGGDVYIRPDADVGDIDPRERPWYEGAEELEEGEVYWTEPYVDAATDELIITVSTPVFDEDGDFAGAIGGDISLVYLSEVVAEHQIGETGYSFIVENDGETMAHPEEQHVLDRFNVEELFSIDFLGDGETGYVEYTYDGEDAIATYRPLDTIEATVFTRVASDEAFGLLSITQETLIIGTVIILVLLSAFVAFYTRKAVLGPIVTLTDVIDRLADFDLRFDEDHSATSYLEREDEIGKITRSVAGMQEGLREVVSEEKEIAGELAASSQELSANSQEMSASAEEVSTAIEEVASGAEEQSAQIDETQENMQELSQEIDSINDRADRMAENADETVDRVREGRKLMNESIEQLQKAARTRKVTEDLTAELVELSDEIGEVIDFISEIAEQTNLLALNASIEAARAGQAGQGFNVVAEEIRELSENTSESTENIAELIEKVQNKISRVNEEMDKAAEVMDSTGEKMEKSVDKYGEVEDITEDLEGIIEDINDSIKKMTSSSSEVTAAMEEIAAVSEQASGNAEEVAAASEEQSATTQEVVEASEKLAELAQELNNQVGKFEI